MRVVAFSSIKSHPLRRADPVGMTRFGLKVPSISRRRKKLMWFADTRRKAEPRRLKREFAASPGKRRADLVADTS